MTNHALGKVVWMHGSVLISHASWTLSGITQLGYAGERPQPWPCTINPGLADLSSAELARSPEEHQRRGQPLCPLSLSTSAASGINWTVHDRGHPVRHR